MNKYFTTQKARLAKINSGLEMPSILIVGLGLLAASPLGGTVAFNSAAPLPVNLASLTGIINSLILERYFYRALMMAGYVVQYHSKVITAIPMALQMIIEAVERMIRVVFTLPDQVYFQTRRRVIDVEMELNTARQRFLKNSQIKNKGWAPRSVLKVQITDDFFWQARAQFSVRQTRPPLRGLALKARPYC
jgi:hypothetical protein